MSIKILDTFEPAGEFELAEAKDIAYSGSYVDEQNQKQSLHEVDTALDILFNRVFAEPKLKYASTDVDAEIAPAIPSEPVAFGDQLSLAFYIDTPSLGQCTVTVYRKINGSESNYKFVQSQQVNKGVVVIQLGSFRDYADYLYKVEVTDGAGKIALTPWGTNFLEFRRYCNSISFSAIQSDDEKRKLFTLDEQEYPYEFTYKIGQLNSYGYLLYKFFEPNIEIPTSISTETLDQWEQISLNSDSPLLVGQGITDNRCLALPKTSASGTHVLATCLVLSTTPELTTNSEIITSAILKRNIDRLTSETLAVVATKALDLRVSTRETCQLSFIAKTTIPSLANFTNTIKLTGTLYHEALNGNGSHCFCKICNRVFDNSAETVCDCADINKVQLTVNTTKNYDETVTHGIEAPLWNLYRIEWPLDKLDPHTELRSLVEVKARPVGDVPVENTLNYYQLFELEKASTESLYRTDDLLFNFDTIADAGIAGQPDFIAGTLIPDTIAAQVSNTRWNDSEGSTQLGLKLFNSIKGQTGVIESTEQNDPVARLNLSYNTYAVMYKKAADGTLNPYSPWTELASNVEAGHNKPAFSIEAYFRNTYIGDKDSAIITLMNKTGSADGFFIDNEKAYIKLKGQEEAQVAFSRDSWHHIVAVFDSNPNVDINGNMSGITDQEDINPYPTIRIYLDGTLVAVNKIDTASWSSIHSAIKDMPPLIINGEMAENSLNFVEPALSVDSLEVINTGKCDLKVLRVYKAALTSKDVYCNYLYTREEEEAAIVENRNTDGLPKIFFIKNKLSPENVVGASEEDEARWADYNAKYKLNDKKTWTKKLNPTTFTDLHSITEKNTVLDSNDNIKHGSKTSLVNCSMYACMPNPDNPNELLWSAVETDVDVYLQGTSSLAYPVKNYQIKVKQMNRASDGAPLTRSKKEILPPFQSDQTGWHTAGSVYTLKCDFMEHSHRNNTPTASYYQDAVLDSVIAAYHKYSTDNTEAIAKHYSPARSIRTEISTSENPEPTSIYRDAIAGFPCVVYYSDNTELDLKALKTTVRFEDLPGLSYAGSYMFNVDKEGKQLGFEISGAEVNYEHSAFSEADKSLIKNDQDVRLSCISYEGSANTDEHAAAFVPFVEAFADEIAQYYAALIRGDTEVLVLFEKSQGKSFNDPEIADDVKTLTSFTEKIKDGTYTLWVYTYDEKKEESEWKPFTRYSYLEATLSPRFSSVDEDNLEETYDSIERAINWISSAKSDTQKFKANFEKYFSLEYCLAYYLQMLLFAQVDNAGKNAMFDIWKCPGVPTTDYPADSKFNKLYPRPYDMDTQMGLNNSGEDKIPEIVELNQVLSPYSFTGELVNAGYIQASNIISNWNTVVANQHSNRYQYNTSNSNLWKTFGTVYRDEIATIYKALRRQGIYSVDAICNYVDKMTSNVIGERFYNRDAAAKYLNYKSAKEVTNEDGSTSTLEGEYEYNSRYLYCISGNRKNRYRDFLTARITFLDSFFDYNTANKTELRIGYIPGDQYDEANKIGGTQEFTGNTRCVACGIRVHRPQYITITVQSVNLSLKTLVTPEDSYIFHGELHPGVLIWLPALSDAGDAEVIISGGANIAGLDHLHYANPTKCLLDLCAGLTELDLTDCAKLSNLTLSPNGYLRKFIFDDAGALDSERNLTIDLSACKDLVEVSAKNSKITSLLLPARSSLTKLDLTKTNIEALEVQGTAHLTVDKLKLTECTRLKELTIKNCPKILIEDDMSITDKKVKTAFDKLIPHGQLRKLILENCDGITKLNLHGSNNLTFLSLKLPSLLSLSLVNTVAPIFDFAWDSTEYTGLDLNDLTSLIYLNLKSTGGSSSANKFGLVRLPNEAKIETLYINESTIKSLAVTGNEIAEGLYDFSSMANLKSLSITKNTAVNRIKKLTYCTTSTSTFSGCSNLVSFDNECRLTIETDCAASTFSSCSALEEIPDHVLSFESQSGLKGNGFFYGCGQLSAETLARTAKLLVAANCPDFTLYAYGNNKLINIPYDFFGVDTEKLKLVKVLTSCFRSCSNLTTLDLTPITVEAVGENEVSSVYAHAFTNMTGVQDVNALFSECTKLEFVPSTIFEEMTQLKNAAYTFYNCVNLGSNAENKSNCILSNYTIVGETTNYNSHVFNKVAPVETIESMFNGCKNLEVNDGLKGFFEDLQTLVRGSLAFYKCSKINGLAANILTDLTLLENIDGMFAGTMSDGIDTTLPLIFGDGTTTMTALRSARGLFSGCKNLTGSIPNGFFTSLTGLVNVGSGTYVPILQSSFGNVTLGGLFMNTKITSLPYNLFNNSTSLKSCSKLICNVDTKGNIIENTVFEGFTDVDDSTILPQVPLNFFNANTTTPTMESIEYAFAGCTKVKTIQGSISTDPEDDLSILPKSLKTARGTFMLSGIESLPSNLFKNKDNLSNIAYMFANCTNLRSVEFSSLFAGCKSLSNCSSLFFQDASLAYGGIIPATLFNSCRGSLTNVSYMFAGCTSLSGSIGVGTATVNDLTALDAAHKLYCENIAKGLINQTNKSLDSKVKEAINARLDVEPDTSIESLGVLAENTAKAVILNELSIKNFNVSDTIFESNIVEKHANYSLTLTIKGTTAEITYSKYKFADYDNNNWQELFAAASDVYSLENYIKDPSHKIVNINQYGLLANCTQLSSVTGMFLNCSNLTGPIPADMFYGDKNLPVALSSIAYLFAGCTRMCTAPLKTGDITSEYPCTFEKPTDMALEHYIAGNFCNVYPHFYKYQDNYIIMEENGIDEGEIFRDSCARYFVPVDWLAKAPYITDIRYAFSRIGISNLNTLSYSNYIAFNTNATIIERIPLQLKIPVKLFDYNISNPLRINKANGAFYFNASIGNSVLTRAFMAESVKNNLTDISYMFALSSLPAITDGTSKFLESTFANSILNNVTGAFAFTNSLSFATAINSDTENKKPVYDWLIGNNYGDFILHTSDVTGLADQEVVDFTNNFNNITSKDRAFRNTYSLTTDKTAFTSCKVPSPYDACLISEDGSTSNYYVYVRPANDAQSSYSSIGTNVENNVLSDQLKTILAVIYETA